MGDLRVPFGLRECATDSEEASWDRESDLDSVFPSDSDADSFIGGLGSDVYDAEFDCLPGEESQLLVPPTQVSNPAAATAAAAAATAAAAPGAAGKKEEVKALCGEVRSCCYGKKERWSEIDERARLDKNERRGVRQERPRRRGGGRGKKKKQQQQVQQQQQQGQKFTHGQGMPKEGIVDLSGSQNWEERPRRSRKGGKQYHKGKDERKILARRPGRHNPPLTGAVVRPFTLPAGPITILRRPVPTPTPLEEQNVLANVSGPGTPETDRLPKVLSMAGVNISSSLESPGTSLPNASQESLGDGSSMCGLGMSYDAHWKSHIVHVTTKYGPGIVVENPKIVVKDFQLDGSESENEERLKAAKDAAELAMAGLSMGKDGRDVPLPPLAQPKVVNIQGRKISADTYDRGYPGSVDHASTNRTKYNRKKNRSSRPKGARKNNIYGGVTSKTMQAVQPKFLLTRTNQTAVVGNGSNPYGHRIGGEV